MNKRVFEAPASGKRRASDDQEPNSVFATPNRAEVAINSSDISTDESTSGKKTKNAESAPYFEDVNPQNILDITATINQQIMQTNASNNILCEEIARRSKAIGNIIHTGIIMKVTLDQKVIDFTYGVLQMSKQFVDQFLQPHWLRNIVAAGKFDENFTNLHSRLNHMEQSIHNALGIPVTPTQTTDTNERKYNANQLLRRFRNMLPELALNDMIAITDLLQMNNTDIGNIFRSELKSTNDINEFRMTLDRLRQNRQPNDPVFRLLSEIRRAVYRHQEAPIPNDQLVIHWDEQLGQGCFGVVLGGLLKGSIPVAVKTMLFERSFEQDFFREMYLMRRLDKYPHILKIQGWIDVIHPQSLLTYRCLITPKCQRTLANAVNDIRFEPPLSNWLSILEQIAKGMSYLALEGIYHRDLKPENVLLTSNGSALITDFGLSVSKSTCKNFIANAGTAGYMAPELFAENVVSELCDVYSFGVVMSFTLFRGPVWIDENGQPLSSTNINRVCQTRVPLLPTTEMFPELSPALVEINQQCCQLSPLSRPRFVEIVKVFDPSTEISMEMCAISPFAKTE